MPFDDPIPSVIPSNVWHKMHSRIENRTPELNGLIDAMLQKKQDDRPSIKELFLNFPILKRAIFDLLKRFLRVKTNFTFERLLMQLLSDNDLKEAYSERLNQMIDERNGIIKPVFIEKL